MKPQKTAFSDLPLESRKRVVFRTIAVTLPTCVVAVVANIAARMMEGATASFASMVISVVLTILICAPVMAFLLANLEKLGIAYVELARYAKRDTLTGLFNRGALISQAQQAATAAKAGLSEVGCLMVIDVDFFKLVNDTHGHDAGDQALQLIAVALQKNARPQDLVGRVGGEEFAVFLRGCHLKEAQAIAERMRHAIETLDFAPNGTIHKLTISVGLSAWPAGAEFKEINKDADLQLYAAKHDGRNRVMSPREAVPADGPKVAA